MKTKVCKGGKFHCNNEKLINEFSKNKGMKDGHRNQCKKCHAKQTKEWVKNNPDKFKIIHKRWREKNKKHKKEYDKQYNQNNKEKNKQRDKRRHEYFRQYYQNNKYKRRKYYNNYYKNKRNNNIEFKLLSNLRRRLNNALKGKNKSLSTMKLLECTIEYLKNYLEKQFYDDMTWNNYGAYWEIDHIIPCSSFNLINEEEQRKCFNWTNLQPLTVKHNREKSNKLDKVNI